jgi:hypothetical protein
MDFIGTVFIVVGIVLSIAAYVMIVIEAFKTTIWWGIGTLLIQIVGLVFVIMYWDQTKKYVMWIILSILLVVIGSMMSNTYFI